MEPIRSNEGTYVRLLSSITTTPRRCTFSSALPSRPRLNKGDKKNEKKKENNRKRDKQITLLGNRLGGFFLFSFPVALMVLLFLHGSAQR